MSTNPTVEILTLSYRGDFEVCRLLCESVDRFLPDNVVHHLVVPGADLELFGTLASPRRRLTAEEDVLPGWFRRMPMPPQRWRKLLRLPRRNIYLTPFSLPVRGWIAQQIMKISAAAQSNADIVIHVDSDTAIIRPIPDGTLVRDGKVSLYRDPKQSGHASHALWQEAAGKLLGLPPQKFYGGEYIDSFVVWKTSVVRDLIAQLSKISRRNWIATLARTQHFSEYVLYGVYADQVAGVEKAGLSATPLSPCHSIWEGETMSASDVDAFVQGVKPHHVACLIQSTLSESLDTRRAIFARVTAEAASQDAGEVAGAT